MFRKSLIIGAVALTFGITSCGGSQSEICDCLDVSVQMMEESEGLAFDDPKMAEIQEKYEADNERCQKVMEKFDAEFEGLSEEEIEKKQKEEFESCPSYAKLKEMMDAQMEAMKEAMGDMDFEDMELEEMEADAAMAGDSTMTNDSTVVSEEVTTEEVQ
jgi:hypothetical protein